MVKSETGRELGDLIKKAIFDLEVTHSEYEEIMNLAQKDNLIDKHEKGQLQQLQDMIANGTVKRVPG